MSSYMCLIPFCLQFVHVSKVIFVIKKKCGAARLDFSEFNGSQMYFAWARYVAGSWSCHYCRIYSLSSL